MIPLFPHLPHFHLSISFLNSIYFLPVHRRSLLGLLTASIMEVASNFQNVAFQLVRSIVDAKIIVPEVHHTFVTPYCCSSSSTSISILLTLYVSFILHSQPIFPSMFTYQLNRVFILISSTNRYMIWSQSYQNKLLYPRGEEVSLYHVILSHIMSYRAMSSLLTLGCLNSTWPNSSTLSNHSLPSSTTLH